MTDTLFEPERLDLSDIVNALLDKGVVLRADAMLLVADVELVALDLGVLLTAVETATRRDRQTSLLASAIGAPDLTPERGRSRAHETPARDHTLVATPGGGARAAAEELPEAQLRDLAPALPQRINVDPEQVDNGRARLVLTLIEVLRKVLEHQAIRRMEGGTLSAQEVERLGVALLRLHDRMQELKAIFGLKDEDLQIDLGPLGRVR